MSLLMYKKISKDRNKEVRLSIEDRKWTQRLIVKGEEIQKKILQDESTAIATFNKTDIGETY